MLVDSFICSNEFPVFICLWHTHWNTNNSLYIVIWSPKSSTLESWRYVYINYLSISYHTIIHLVFSGTFDLMSLKVKICLGQYATGGVWQMLARKINHKVLVWKWICNPMQAIKTGKKNLIQYPEEKLFIQAVQVVKFSYSF